MLISTGIPSKEDIEKIMPPAERLSKGSVVMIECFQEIACNPCVAACKFGAITMEKDMNSLPEVDFDKCTGCNVCLFQCPGLAIFIIDQTFSDKLSLVKIPFEYRPLPKVGQYACGLDREGKERGWFKVNRVTSGGKRNMTYMISLEVPHDLSMEIRNIQEGAYRDA
ncbi:MAG: 4Fe-4S dicluster domain-containing protein [Clostridiaceae bacterium]|nr:4Fe-4S dicluster domain-containing protein [Clostridiaceae bacterium]